MAISLGVVTPPSNTTAPGRTGNGTLSVTLPAGWAAGQVAVLLLYCDHGYGTVPTDWTEFSGSPWGSTPTAHLQAFWKVLVAGEVDPVTTISGSGTGQSNCGVIATFNDVDRTTPIEVVGVMSEGTGTPMTAASINTLTNGAWVLGLCGRGDNETSGSQTFGGSATGVSELVDAGTDATLDSQCSIYAKTIPVAGATGNGSAVTSNIDPWVSVLVALKPSGAYVHDSPIVTEATTIRLPKLFISQSENVTATDAIAVGLVQKSGGFNTRRFSYHFFDNEDTPARLGVAGIPINISRNDAPTTTDALTILLTAVLNVSDSPIATDVPSIRLAQLKTSLSDAPTVTDARSTVFTLSLSRNDSPIVTEAVSIVLKTLYASVVDAPTVTESPTLKVTVNRSVSDSPVTTDVVSLVTSLSVSQSDTPIVTDAVSVVTALSVSKNDQSIITDAVSFVAAASTSRSDAPTVTEALSISFTLSTSQNDQPIVTESASPVLSTLTIFVSETSVVTDALSMYSSLGIPQSEDATATDAISVVFSLSTAQNDSSVVTDAVSFILETTLSRSDSPIVDDDAVLVIKTLHIVESDEPVATDGQNSNLSGLAPKPHPSDSPQATDAAFIDIVRMEQTRFLWRDDDGDEDEATALAAINVNIMHERNINARLRVQIDSVGDTDPSEFQLEFRKVSDGPDGAWTVVS